MDETKLLQQIRDYLYQMLAQIDQYLSDISEDVDAIKENTDVLPDMADDIADIKTNSDSLPDIEAATESADTKLTTTNATLSDIKTNSGAIITPINNVKLNTDAIKTDVSGIAADTTVIKNNMNTVATAAATAAAFDEDIATNTLNILDKMTTCVSDTTQMRADMANIISILNLIYDKL